MFESSSFSSRRQFQKGLDTAKQRALRRDSELSLRRKQREEHLQKRRKKALSSVNNGNRSNVEGEPQETPAFESEIPKYIGMIYDTTSILKQLEGTRSIRKLLSIERDPPTIKIVRTGVIPKIISFMYGSDKNNNNNNKDDIKQQLKFEAAWVITNIAASSSDLVSIIVKNNAIEAFVDLFRNTSNLDTADQAIWGLGNIAGDKKIYRDRILNNTTFLNDIISNIFDFNEVMLKNTVWTISNLFRWKDHLLKVSDIHEISQVLNKILIDCKNDDIISDCIWAFHYISSNPCQGILNYLVLQTEIVNQCIRLLDREKCKYELALVQMQQQQSYFNGSTSSNDKSLQNTHKKALLKMNDKIYRPILRFLGNILSEEDNLTQIVLNANYLDIIEPFSNHFYSGIRREIMWSFSNILAGNHQQIESLISRDKLLTSIMNAGMNGAQNVRKEAAWCICNAMADAITAQKKTLVEHGAIEVLCGMLAPQHHIKENDLMLVLEGLEGILSIYGTAGSHNPYAEQFEELGGLDHLERIQADDVLSQDAYNAIVALMKKYYGTDDEIVVYNDGEEGQLLLNTRIDTNTNHFAFGVGQNHNNNMNNNFGGNKNNPFGGFSNNNNENRQIYQF